MRVRIAAAAVIVTVALPLGLASAAPKSSTIDLPSGFAGEGVAIGPGTTFYAGSRTSGQIARGDLNGGPAEVWVEVPTLSSAVGLDADVRHDLLWAAGGATGKAAVYDLDTGDAVATLTLTTAAMSFINDVVSTREAAYFTNSRAPELFRVPVSSSGNVGAPQTIALKGPAATDFVAGAFNLNGIEATPNGRTLIVVNSRLGRLYTVDTRTWESALIDLGGATVRTGDGILLSGRTLYVLQNGNAAPAIPNQITVIRLSPDLRSGTVVDTLTSPLFENATTLAKHGDVLVAVNAQFAPIAPIDREPEVVLLKQHGRP